MLLCRYKWFGNTIRNMGKGLSLSLMEMIGKATS
jgi:hypothetical protein